MLWIQHHAAYEIVFGAQEDIHRLLFRVSPLGGRLRGLPSLGVGLGEWLDANAKVPLTDPLPFFVEDRTLASSLQWRKCTEMPV